MTASAMLSRHRVHAALFRPVLFLGVAPGLAVLEVTIVCAVAFLVGWQLTTLIVIALALFVLHPLAVWMTTQDPLMLAIYARSLTLRDFYPPHTPPWTTASPVRSSIPTPSSR